MSNLYDLSAELRAVHEDLADAGGELTPVIQSALDRLKATLPQKIDQYVNWAKQLAMEEAACREEAERWTRKARSREKAQAWIKQALQDHMDAHGLTEAGNPLRPVRLVDNGGMQKMEHTLPKRIDRNVNTTIYDLIPAHYALNEQRLREALEAGQEIPGAKLLPRGKHVRMP